MPASELPKVNYLIKGNGRKTLITCCGAHLIQDGLGALQYVLLPILAQLFGLNYAQVGLRLAAPSELLPATRASPQLG